jgi:hypothetical protein
VVTDKELIEGLSFTVCRRAQSHQASSVETVVIDPRDLQSAQDQDAAAKQLPAAEGKSASGRS